AEDGIRIATVTGVQTCALPIYPEPMIRERLRRIAHEQSFHPAFWGVFVNPFFIARRGLVNAVREFAHHVHGRLLDVGCGSKPYRSEERRVGKERRTNDGERCG